MGDNQIEESSLHNHKGQHGYQTNNDHIDIFSLSCLFLLLISVAFAGLYLLTKTDTGKFVLEALAGFRQVPILIILLAFIAAPVSVLIGFKSEVYRDMFIVNAVFIIIALVLYMYYQLRDGIIISELPYLFTFGISFRVDPLTFMILAAAAFLWLLAAIYSHYYVRIEEEHRGRFYFWMLATLGGVLGAIMAADMLTMFFFFEIMNFCCYFLVSHNQSEAALRAGNRYLYMGVMAGLSILLGIILLTVYAGTFDIVELHEQMQHLWAANPGAVIVATISILFGFAVKAAIFPFHFWLPDAHSSAPSPASALLSGMVIKVYIFSLMKFMFRVLGPDITTAMGLTRILPPLAAVGMIMGSVFAIGNKDIKRILAYSTVAQVGYLLLGIGMGTELGFSASLFHVISHFLMKSALFLSAGAIILQKGTRDVNKFQGLGYEMPITLGVFVIGSLSMIGIPGLSGFMSKWYLAIASLDIGRPVYVVMILVSSFLNAMYYLPIMNIVFLSERDKAKKNLTLDKLPMTMLIPLILLGFGCVFFGIFPQLIMNYIQTSIAVFY